MPFHIWNSLVEKAGLKVADAPKTWDAFWDYFKPAQEKLRSQGMRGVYSLGLQATTNGPADGNNLFSYFLAAYGGYDIVTPDGKPHLDDPEVKKAVIKTITYITTAFKQGYVPPGALDWGDADDNNAFHAKQIVMDLDGTISTELAMIHDPEKYNDAVTLGLPNDNSGKPIPSPLDGWRRLHPERGQERRGRQGVRQIRHPAESGRRVPEGRGWRGGCRRFRSIVKDDPWWTDPKDPHRLAYVQQGVLGKTVPRHYAYNPGHVRGQRRADLGYGACQRHPRQRQSGSRSRRGLEAHRHHPREVPDRAGLRGKR